MRFSFGLTLVWSAALCFGCGSNERSATPTIGVPSAALRVERLDPGLETGAPYLRLHGGGLRAAIDVPLWLTFDDTDRAYDNCSNAHEYVVVPLPERRVYVAQYNAHCGSSGECRVFDTARGTFERPVAGCLWGEGVHHYLESVAGDVFVLRSDSEGVGHVDLVRYDASHGAERLLRLGTSATGSLEYRVREGGVDFTSPCPLPPGCAHEDYTDAPIRTYRWTVVEGLVPASPMPPG